MIRLDPKASEALASAVAAAKQNAAGPKPEATESAKLGASSRLDSKAPLLRAVAAAALVAACGLASFAGTQAQRSAAYQSGAEVAALNQDAFARLTRELESVRTDLASLKAEAGYSSQASASDRDKLDQKIEALAAALRKPDVTSSALEARLDRMESQIMSTLGDLSARTAAAPAAQVPAPAAAAPLAPVAPAAPALTEASLREPEPTPPAPPVRSARNEPVDGWIVREVYDGAALVEGRNRRLYEVAPGGIVPGVGRVEAIERRGRSWVVLTDKGFIGSYR
ncbi:hypothetical protein [Microvirga subterranea]|uniref:Uncharacterized protein n=1 Tax=Microvirga subterranea TaxID=186651 RepID=A0A370HV34_9HYPH|nr:hypothetical protein [Microvirga subterranea]RDI61811.1 hypothetical protein DES45_10168 [Microvirga subterranea]